MTLGKEIPRKDLTVNDIKIGDLLSSKTGEIMLVRDLSKDKFAFQMYHPKTRTPSGFVLEGETSQLGGFFKETQMKVVSNPEKEMNEALKAKAFDEKGGV